MEITLENINKIDDIDERNSMDKKALELNEWQKKGVVVEIKIGAVSDRIPVEAISNETTKVVFANETVPNYIASLDSLASFEDASFVDLDNRPSLNSKKNFKRNKIF